MAAITGIDHLIIAVGDLHQAVTVYGTILGFHISGGGTHPHYGTMNRIIVLSDDYLELLAVQPGQEAKGPVGDLARRGGGAMACVLGVDDPAGFAAELRAHNVAVEGPVSGKLETADRFSRGWQTVTFPDGIVPGLPFVIKHDTSGATRRELLAGSAGLKAHPNGAKHVVSVTLAVRNLDEAANRLERVLQLSPAETGTDAMLAAQTLRIPLPSGAGLMLASPAHAGVGPIAAALDAHGESMFAFCVAVEDLPAIVRDLRGRGVGVRVDEPGGVLVAAQLHHQAALGARISLVRVN